MKLDLDNNQQFIFEKIKVGLTEKNPPEPINDTDIERLVKPLIEYSSGISEQEWNDWSRKIHWALQVAFWHDTSWLEDKTPLTIWRQKCMAIAQSYITKPQSQVLVIDSSVVHLLKEDLQNYLIQVFGYENLTDEEQRMIHIINS